MSMKRRGRPPKPASERKGDLVQVRLTEAQKSALQRYAESQELTLSDLIRRAVDQAVEAALKSGKKKQFRLHESIRLLGPVDDDR